MKKRLLFDVDDVFAQCLKKMLVEVNAWNRQKYPPLADIYDIVEDDLTEHWDLFVNINASDELIKHVSDCMRSEGWCRSLEPFPGTIEAVERAKSIAEVFCVTAPFDGPHWVHERLAWLKHHFDIDRKHVVQTHSKFLVKGDVFVDDNPGHVRDWKEAHPDGIGLLWARPWNAKNTTDLERVTSWENFFDKVQLDQS